MAKRRAPTQMDLAPDEPDILPSERLLMLMGFIGQDLLMHTRRRAQLNMQPEGVEITGRILGGRFKVTVSFDGETSH